MNWAKERDLLIAQSRAFVQSIGKKPAIETPAATRLEFNPVEVARTAEVKKVETPAELAATARPILRSEVRDEIQGRVAAFRAHQQLFHRERDAYFNSVLARVREPTRQPPKPTGG